jgi:hypothetical protein
MKLVLYSSPNQTRTQEKKKNYRPISLMNLDTKILKKKKYLQTAFNSISKYHTYQKDHTPGSSWFHPSDSDGSTYANH